jgi:hypothetical protein
VLCSRGTALSSHFTRCLKLLLFQQTNVRAHGRIQSALRIPRCETGCDACSHKSAKSSGEY